MPIRSHRTHRHPSTPSTRRHPARLIATISAVLPGLLVSCEQAEQPTPPPPTVEVAQPELRSVTEYFQYTGTLEPIASVEIRARIAGYLTDVTFRESTTVEQGEVLFTIEKEPYEVVVGQAQAAVERAKAARSLAAARLERTKKAVQANAASDLELLEADAEVQQAEADVFAAKEALKAAELDLSYTDVRSPITGRVDRNYVDVGNLVGRQEPTLLAKVVTLDPIRVSFDVSETIALRYLSSGRNGSLDERPDRPDPPNIEVGLADEEGYPHLGRMDFVDSGIDKTTGTLRVRALLPNPTAKLYPGLFASIRVPWETRENTTVIREEAVGTGLEGKFVLVVDETNTVSRTTITLGERLGDGFVAVLDGLAPNDTYIVRGIQKARPGATVQTKPFAQANPPQPPKKAPTDNDAEDATTPSGEG